MIPVAGSIVEVHFGNEWLPAIVARFHPDAAVDCCLFMPFPTALYHIPQATDEDSILSSWRWPAKETQ